MKPQTARHIHPIQRKTKKNNVRYIRVRAKKHKGRRYKTPRPVFHNEAELQFNFNVTPRTFQRFNVYSKNLSTFPLNLWSIDS